MDFSPLKARRNANTAHLLDYSALIGWDIPSTPGAKRSELVGKKLRLQIEGGRVSRRHMGHGCAKILVGIER